MTTTPTQTTNRPTAPPEPVPGSHQQLVRTGAWGLAGLWLAVLAISVFSPDMVTGSEHNAVPIAAVLTWIWGVITTRSLVVALAAHRDRPDLLRPLRLLTGGVVLIWWVAAALSVWGPVDVTGSDPTKMPVWAILAPIAAMVLSTTACQLFGSLTRRPGEPARRR